MTSHFFISIFCSLLVIITWLIYHLSSKSGWSQFMCSRELVHLQGIMPDKFFSDEKIPKTFCCLFIQQRLGIHCVPTNTGVIFLEVKIRCDPVLEAIHKGFDSLRVVCVAAYIFFTPVFFVLILLLDTSCWLLVFFLFTFACWCFLSPICKKLLFLF